MRLVLDTNVMIAAMRSRKGASARLVLAGLSGGVTLVCSVPLFVEYEAVMTRAEHLVAAKVTRERIVVVLDDLARVIDPATRDISWRPQLTDADDETAAPTRLSLSRRQPSQRRGDVSESKC
jgi:predicted nucleic acid-binding protein